ncbi:MAG TPA: hypothetical protein VGI83_00395, partial [Gemmatimonadales bacterium]
MLSTWWLRARRALGRTARRWRWRATRRSRPAPDVAPPYATIPIEHLDFARSPLTGVTKATWQRIAEALLANVLQYAD